MKWRALLVTLPLFVPHLALAQQGQIKLENIRAQTDEQQEQVRLVRERLAVMSKALMVPSLVQTTVDVADETTPAFKLVSARVVVDGALQYDRKEIGSERQLPVFTGALAQGEHNVKAELVLRGNGFGVFSYLRGYTITLTSSHTFTVASGGPLHVTATAYELSDVTVPFERRPQLRWFDGKTR